jgi:hypothetical protein
MVATGSWRFQLTNERHDSNVSVDKIKTEKDVNIKSEKEEDSTLIRSPLVAGALHEECKWLDIEEAKEISQIFNDIHNSPQFQRLIAKLKGIVSAM